MHFASCKPPKSLPRQSIVSLHHDPCWSCWTDPYRGEGWSPRPSPPCPSWCSSCPHLSVRMRKCIHCNLNKYINLKFWHIWNYMGKWNIKYTLNNYGKRRSPTGKTFLFSVNYKWGGLNHANCLHNPTPWYIICYNIIVKQ